MSLYTARSTGGDNVALLLRELYAARAENRYLRKRVSFLTASRDRWRNEARIWKWGALR